jgi:DNA-directed RNA polymerase specialized sigma24 family protein
MLRVLKDYRRQKQAAMRGGGSGASVCVTVALDRLPEGQIADRSRPQDVVEIDALDEALAKLEAEDPRSADILKMRVVWGMSMAEIADAMDVSVSTLDRDWKWAKAWLAGELGLIED